MRPTTPALARFDLRLDLARRIAARDSTVTLKLNFMYATFGLEHGGIAIGCDLGEVAHAVDA